MHYVYFYTCTCMLLCYIKMVDAGIYIQFAGHLVLDSDKFVGFQRFARLYRQRSVCLTILRANIFYGRCMNARLSCSLT